MAEITSNLHRQLQRVDDPHGVVMLLRIDEGLGEVVRIASDTRDWVSNGEAFIGIPMDIQPPQDVSGENSRAQISIGNPGRELVGELEKMAPGQALEVTLMLISRARPDVIEWEYVAGASVATANPISVSLTIGNDHLFRGRAVKLRYDPETAPGIFAG